MTILKRRYPIISQTSYHCHAQDRLESIGKHFAIHEIKRIATTCGVEDDFLQILCSQNHETVRVTNNTEKLLLELNKDVKKEQRFKYTKERNMESILEVVTNEDRVEDNINDKISTPDGTVVLPAYVPSIAETIKASGAHRQGWLP